MAAIRCRVLAGLLVMAWVPGAARAAVLQVPPAAPVPAHPSRPAGGAALRLAGGVGGYQNPVFGTFADPMAFASGTDGYYSYGTGSGFPIARSTDLVHWRGAGTALSARPSWVSHSRNPHSWAPSVLAVPVSCPGTTSPACYHLFYVGLNTSLKPAGHCVGVATATAPAGPFTDQGILRAALPAAPAGRPIGCGDAAGYGNIDPAPFTDADGRTYLYTSTDFACTRARAGDRQSRCRLQPTISVIPLAADGLRASGGRIPLFAGRAHGWEGGRLRTPVVENPSVTRRGAAYVMFYSGGDWRGAYGMGYAKATSPLGPFTRPSRRPFLAQTASVFSPGGGSTVIGPRGGEWLVYHARASVRGGRTLRIDPLRWNARGGLLRLDPTTSAQTITP